MRFCPFCAQENPDEGGECIHCGKRLPAQRAAPKPAPRPRPAPPAPTALAPKPAAARPVSTPAAEVPKPAAAGPTPAAHVPEPAAATAKPAAEAAKPVAATKPVVEAPAPTEAPKPAATAPKPAPEAPKPAAAAPKPAAAAPKPAAAAPKPAPEAPKPAPEAPKPAAAAPKPAPSPVAAARPPLAASTGTLLGIPSPELPTRVPAAAPEHPVEETPPIDDDVTDRTPRLDGEEEEPPEDLPAPPEVAPPLDVVAPPPPAEPSPTPFLPTMALPPMPAAPSSSSVVAAIRYLPPVARAVWARRRAQKTIGELLIGDQRLLDRALRDLGCAAREAELDLPLIADEMKKVHAQEERRAQAQAAIADAQARLEAEHERWNGDESARREAIARGEEALKKTEEELKATNEKRRAHETERARVDGQIRAAEKRAAQETAKAEKAEQTPPEKGGGAAAAASARSAAEAARKEATALIPARDDARGKAEALDAPLAALAKRVTDEKTENHEQRKQLGEATLAHKKSVGAIEGDRHRADVDRAGAEREISQRFVSVGTLLNLNRVESEPFLPIYARIDELKNDVNAREAALARLETERNSYDRAVVQKGLLAFGVAVGVLALVVVILVVLLSR
jgi:hypothetical protein